MQRTESDLSVGTLGLRVVRTLWQVNSATASGLAVELDASTAQLQRELTHLQGLGIVVSEESAWRVSIEGSQQWAAALECHLLGAA